MELLFALFAFLTSMFGVETYEDGSGRQYVNGEVVRHFPADTFVWDCRYMGNRTCGDPCYDGQPDHLGRIPGDENYGVDTYGWYCG